jgi:Uma2 family endonuclease
MREKDCQPSVPDGTVAVGWHLPFLQRRDERMGMAGSIYYTADMIRAMPDDGKRYEVVYGELLVTPAPRPWHQRLVHRLSLALGNYLQSEPGGIVLAAPADISWGRDVLVQPDVFVVPTEDARTLDWSRMRTLLLVAEVLNTSTAHGNRFLKRVRYREAGVQHYWLVDGDERSVEIWTPSDDFPAIERERLVWHPPGARQPFTLRLEELFRPRSSPQSHRSPLATGGSSPADGMRKTTAEWAEKAE